MISAAKYRGREDVCKKIGSSGKRNHLHFQLLPRLKGETIGYQNFVREEGVLTDYQETANLYREALKNISL